MLRLKRLKAELDVTYTSVRYAACQDYDIGAHSLQQNIKGHPVIFYRFPARLVLPKGSAVIVWANEAPASQHRHRHRQQQQQQQQQKSIEIVNKGVDKWLSDAHCTTMVCQSTGQVWYYGNDPAWNVITIDTLVFNPFLTSVPKWRQ